MSARPSSPAFPVRLELVMTTPHLSDDDVRDLFSDHLEGSLDEATRRAVDDALAKNPALAAEQRAFARTVSALRALPRPEAPADLALRVRDRLAAERNATAGGAPALPRAANDDAVVSTGSTATPWWSPLRIVTGLVAAAAAVAVISVAVPDTAGGPGDVLGASVIEDAVAVRWQVPGLEAVVVATAARASGMRAEDGAFVGDRAAAARFLVELKTAAAAGHDVDGTIPEQADTVRVTVVR
jgi:anti-sigma factor RsiW